MSFASRAATFVCPAPYRELFLVQEKALSNELLSIRPAAAGLDEEEGEEAAAAAADDDEPLISTLKAF